MHAHVEMVSDVALLREHRVTGLEQLAVLAAGLGAGILTSTVGVASLLSFPVLVAVGLPPVVANASNTVGMTPAGLSGSFGYRRELREHPGVTAVVIVTCAVGSVAGAILLLALPPGVFEAVVPVADPVHLPARRRPADDLAQWLRRRHGDDAAEPRTHMSPVTTVFAALTGVYGGYFGAGSGVMMVAVLGLRHSTSSSGSSTRSRPWPCWPPTSSPSVIFLFVADLDWPAVGLLAAGSVVGGYVGARIGRRLPPTLLPRR